VVIFLHFIRVQRRKIKSTCISHDETFRNSLNGTSVNKPAAVGNKQFNFSLAFRGQNTSRKIMRPVINSSESLYTITHTINIFPSPTPMTTAHDRHTCAIICRTVLNRIPQATHRSALSLIVSSVRNDDFFCWSLPIVVITFLILVFFFLICSVLFAFTGPLFPHPV
jgi:hypothetical protein